VARFKKPMICCSLYLLVLMSVILRRGRTSLVQVGTARRGQVRPTEEWVEPNTGSTIRIRRALGGEPMPLDSLYTTILDPGERGPNLRGLSCYVPDWLIPGNDAEKSHKAKLDELFI
ncbi:hypothetical protein, partial [Inhella sp.]|uniref:hypothetical protein n=1 Tax=Inhella sp. TaxID=1921806 RepID=UPI0035B17AA3